MDESFNKEWETIFRKTGLQSIKTLKQYFMNAADMEVKENVVDFLLASAQNKFFPYAIVLSTIYILREYSQTTTDAISLSKRAAMHWYLNYNIRNTLANSLNTTESRECHLEALKQKIIGCSLEIYHEKNKKNTSIEDFQRIKSQHFGRLDNIKSFLDGNKKSIWICWKIGSCTSRGR